MVVRVVRRWKIKKSLKQNVQRCGRFNVLAANHVRHALQSVIGDNSNMKA